MKPVDSTYLNKLEQWTKDAAMFTTSPEGAAFAEEMREVIRLARQGLTVETAASQ